MIKLFLADQRYLNTLLFLALVGVSAYLRFANLGYSEYQDDEYKAMMTIQEQEFSWDSLLDQRKGPVQFFATRAISFFVADPLNEHAYRIPFALANLGSVVVVWLILRRLFENSVTVFWGALIYSVNGFFVGFGRIVQYQSLNLLFSFLAFYFFLRLYQDMKKPYFNSMLGTAFFCLSLLSHWDAVFFLIPIAYFYISYALKEGNKSQVVKVTLANIFLGCVLLLPFLVPYISNFSGSSDNARYFARRVGGGSYPWKRHLLIFKLYNPFITLFLLVSLASLALLRPKKNALWIGWFAVNLFLIRVLMVKPGTHIYNYVIPLIFLATIGFDRLLKSRVFFSWAALFGVLAFSLFLVYQAHMLFVDHSPEYPWFEKPLITVGPFTLLAAPAYTDYEILTFGFPHFRDWRVISDLLQVDPDDCSYITNEGTEISRSYMPPRLRGKPCYYYVRVNRPFNNRGRHGHLEMPEDKVKVHSYEQDGVVLVDVYKAFLE